MREDCLDAPRKGRWPRRQVRSLFLLPILVLAFLCSSSCFGFSAVMTPQKAMFSGVSISEAADTNSIQQNSLLMQATYPSLRYRPPNLEVSFRSTESSILPLQKYHAKKVHDGDSSYAEEISRRVKQSVPSLEHVIQNPSYFNLSVSSKILVEQYCQQQQENVDASYDQIANNSTTTVDPKFLLNKIRMEVRASTALDPLQVLEILYCDEHICVANKPSGVLSVPGPRRNPSMANLVYDAIQPTLIDDVDQAVAHRLDMSTSGILVYAMSLQALSNLHKAFSKHSGCVQKTYQCLVEGHLRLDGGHGSAPLLTDGDIDVALERDPDNPPFMRVAQPRSDDGIANGAPFDDLKATENDTKTHKFWREAPKPSRTTFTILQWEYRNGRPVTRLEMRPWTGRTHQLRVHTSQVLGTPIVGDDIYGGEIGLDSDDALCLHAKRLCLYHPISGAPMIFEADPPF